MHLLYDQPLTFCLQMKLSGFRKHAPALLKLLNCFTPIW